MAEHSVEVVGTGEPGNSARAFCSCLWYIEEDGLTHSVEQAIAVAKSHLAIVGRYSPGHCGEGKDRGLGCPVLQIDGDYVFSLHCDFCGAHWVWEPTVPLVSPAGIAISGGGWTLHYDG